MQKLENMIAIVTGGGSGMGRAISAMFAVHGCRIAVADINEEGAQQTVDLVRSKGGVAKAFPVDIADMRKVETMVQAVVEEFGGLDILVNCAGIGESTDSTVDALEEEWDRVLNVNLKGPFWTSKQALPHMLKKGRGAIINIASINGIRPGVGPAYTTSKHGLVGLTKQLAAKYCSSGIRVNAIAPGAIITPLLPKGDDPERPYAFFADKIPAGRPGDATEIASMALFLASDDASYVHGQIIAVDGAWLLAI
jgi:3-oxoacyl-[acyl-carrier protein] reductase